MKSFVRRNLTLLLASSSLVLSIVGSNVSVLALTQQEIKEKLDAVPVWMITNPQGLPLQRQLPNGNSVTGVYMSKAEAQAFIKEMQAVKHPDPKMVGMIKSLQAKAVPLGSIYQQVQQTKNQPKRLQFAFKPVDKETKGAINLLRLGGQDVKQFKSVPMFLVKFASDKGYVPIVLGSDKKEFFPAFLSNQDASSLLNQIKPKYASACIQVVDVDGVLKTLQDKNDKWLEQVVFFPSSEARAYIRTLSKSNGGASQKNSLTTSANYYEKSGKYNASACQSPKTSSHPSLTRSAGESLLIQSTQYYNGLFLDSLYNVRF